MDKLFEKVYINKLDLKNRIIRSATNEHLSDCEGNVTEELMKTYIQLAKGGVGLLITGHYSVDREIRADIGQPVLDDKIDRAKLRAMISKVHKENCKIFIQISHPGPKAGVYNTSKYRKSPAEYSEKELLDITNLYIDGAVIAKDLGFDGIQVHMAHGYFLSSFIDPVQNTRADSFGGTTEKRFYASSCIIKGIKEACGESYPVIVKINSNASDPSKDYTNDFKKVVELCIESGVDAIEVSGNDFNNMPPKLDRPYYLENILKANIAFAFTVPVILTGGIDTRDKMEMVIDKGIPLVGVSRCLINNPSFINELKSGEMDKSSCKRCNRCYTSCKESYKRCILHDREIEHFKRLYSAVKSSAT